MRRNRGIAPTEYVPAPPPPGFGHTPLDRPEPRRRWGVLGSTYVDARDVAEHLPLDIQTVPLSIGFPAAAYGITLDALVITPRANQDPGLRKALDVIYPALATRTGQEAYRVRS